MQKNLTSAQRHYFSATEQSLPSRLLRLVRIQEDESLADVVIAVQLVGCPYTVTAH